ncbi:MAG TPA: YjbH domain-containing protein [Xanthomonadaceae bacterium]|nr:YjbH domain-containing protein [Xanthomonadaceae bacterium]
MNRIAGIAASAIGRISSHDKASNRGTLARRKQWLSAFTPLALCIAGVPHAQDAPYYYTQNDFGETGLLQTPSARMADEGQVGFSYSRTEPYTRLNVFGQPFSWLEGSFRYTIVSNRGFAANPNPGNGQSYKDKSIDVKVRLLEESHYLPAVAVGIRDLAGTGLFSSEYFVGSKRVGPLDFSLGLAWGYLGGRGNLPNPFGWIDSDFDHRSATTPGATTGEFTASNYFRGPTALFGGVEYQTPLSWLRLKAELDGNNYKHEPLDENLPQRWPVNLGAVFRVNHYIDVTLGYERGNTAMASFSIHDNLAQRTDAPKPFDPVPEPVAPPPVATVSGPASTPPTPTTTTTAKADWAAVSRILEQNAGISVNHIAQRGSELLVYGEQKRFFYGAEGLGRAARILNNRLDSSIEWITFVPENHGLPIVEDSVHRPKFVAYLDHDIDLPTLRRSVEQDPTALQAEQVLYAKPLKRWDFSLLPGYNQSIGGPDAPIIYQFTADGKATYHFTNNLWFDAQVNVNLANNFNLYTFDAPSKLPRVRTDVRLYLESSNVVMPLFQLTGTRQLGTDLYGMAYAGMFESMFGGVGGEVLYRPLGEPWAFGVDANYVGQRGFDQDFSFRNYRVATGQATFYYDTGWQGLHTAISAGRYLAGDWGTTLDLSRHFDNGVRMGAYATFTTAGSKYGEGSFDKGVYISVPFDLFLPLSRSDRADVMWEPLLRDGGARLDKEYHLYDMTDDRDGNLFDQNMNMISH